MNLTQTIFLLALSLSASYAQTWSQPVRESDRAARAAIVGECGLMQVESGYSGSGLHTCSFRSITPGSPAQQTVPAGKILVIEDIASSCSKHSADQIFSLRFEAGVIKNLPLELRGTLSNGRQSLSSSIPVRMYVPAGASIIGNIDTGANATQLVNCSIRFHGHFVSAQ